MLCGTAWRLRLPSDLGAAVVHVERFRLCGCSSHRSHQPRAARVTREALSAEQISGFGKSDSRACGERARGKTVAAGCPAGEGKGRPDPRGDICPKAW